MASQAAERTAAALPGAERGHLAPPPQEQQEQPGKEQEMNPRPLVMRDGYRGSGKLAGLAALVTGACRRIGLRGAAAARRRTLAFFAGIRMRLCAPAHPPCAVTEHAPPLSLRLLLLLLPTQAATAASAAPWPSTLRARAPMWPSPT